MNKRTAMAIVAAAVIVAITIATRAMIAMLTQQTSFSLALFSNNANAQQENITGKKLVQTRDIADGAITNPKLAPDAITTNKIKDDNVSTSYFANNSVTRSKLASDAIQPHYEFTSQAAGSLLIPAHKWIDFQSSGCRDGGIAVAGGYVIYSPNHREIIIIENRPSFGNDYRWAMGASILPIQI